MRLLYYSFTGLRSLCVGAIFGVATTGVSLAQSLPCPPRQLQRLIPPCEDPGSFGQSLSISGSRLAVGRFDTQGGRISTYELDPETRLWQSEAELRPNDLNPFDAFGYASRIHYHSATGRWLLAGGSPSKSDMAQSAGKAYVHAINGEGRWIEQASIRASPVVPFGWFGNQLCWATEGNRLFLVVGAPGSWGQQLIGSVYVFEESGIGNWQQRAVFQAPDGVSEDNFGNAISSAESENVSVLLVGASGFNGLSSHSGRAYAYRFDTKTDEWVFEAEFEAPDPYDLDEFGKSVSVAPVYGMPGFTHRAAIGRRSEGGFGSTSGPGAVYLYLRTTDGNWEPEAHLVPPLANSYDMSLGHRVELERDGSPRLLAAAINSREFGPESGGVFLFERDAGTGEWQATQALYAQQQDGYDGFGVDFAFGDGDSAGTVAIGALATQCPGGTQFDAVGAVYSFDLNPGEPGNCPPPVLTLQKVPDCFSGPGGEIEVRWFQATPDQQARIALLYAKRTGNFVIPNGNPCSGTALQLGQLGLQVAHTGSAGQFGAGRIKRTVPRSVCGGYLQLVDITRCATSNVVRIE